MQSISPEVKIEQFGNTWVIKGNTYPHRRELASVGAKWDGLSKQWKYIGNSLPALIAELETKLPTIEQPAPQAEPEKPKRKRKSKHTQIETPDVEPGGIIKPCYWDKLTRYLAPGNARPAVALVGPAGNGKTTVAEAALEALGYEYIVIDATEYLEPADLIGSMTYDPAKGEVWRDGPVVTAFRNKKAIIINEFDALNPRAALCLQSVTQEPGANKKMRYATTPGCPDHDRVFPEGDCPLIVTMNTYGTGATRQYVGRNALDAATADRFTIISTGYENEVQILESRGFSTDLAERLQKWAVSIRQKIDQNSLRVILSNRTLLRIAQAVEIYGIQYDQALLDEFFERLEAETRELLAGKKLAF